MKNTIISFITAAVVSIVTMQLSSFIQLPFGQSYSGNIIKDTSTKVVQERIEEFKKINNIESDVTRAIDIGAPSVVSIITTKELTEYINDPFSFFIGQGTQQATPKNIKSTQKVKVGGGSGIIISKDGFIITNKHVVVDTNAEYSVITTNGDTLYVKKIWLDPMLDIAVLQVTDAKGTLPTDLQPAKFISYNSPVHIGQFTIAIGNALTEFSNSATFGIISAKNRTVDTTTSNKPYIGLYQTDAPVNVGNSGGPLLNTAGEVIGMNTIAQAAGIGFAMPLSQEFIENTLLSLTGENTIARPTLGLDTKLLTKAVATNLDMQKFEGVYVQTVQPNLPAANSGILSGDIITEINGRSVQVDMPLLYTLYTFKPGETISALVFRNKEYKKIEITLGMIQ